MLDAITSLAFSMHSSPGVYALLLGSGVSRSANIPTGWEITLELARKAAAVDGVAGAAALSPDATVAWHRNKFGVDPDYARLLDGLAKSQPERQQVLKRYIEPTDAEREQGHKLPTPAHHAIAKLVAVGKVRVIVTTNFDQLLEAALRDAGIVPTVIDSADAALGAVPLVHSPCTVIKIHGDYMDTRIRNTPAELEQFEPALDQLLDRVFDEFGLIVCGWSADWDVALKAAIMRTPTRRYSMYWAARGTPSAAAQALIAQRGMSLIAIDGADSFFTALEAKVAALDEFNAPHPMSTEIAVTQLKKYLAEDRYRIALDDLVRTETKHLIEALDRGGFSLDPRGANQFVDDTQRYESLSTTLVTMAMVAGQWSSGDQIRPWVDAMQALARRAENKGGLVHLIELMRWPAALVMHAYAIGAVAQEREATLAPLLTAEIRGNNGRAWRALDRLNAGTFFENGPDRGRSWMGYEQSANAVTDRLYNVLLPIGVHVLGSEQRFERAFVGVELLIGLAFAEHHCAAPTPEQPEPHFWVPTGRYGATPELRESFFTRWKTDPGLLRAAVGLQAEPRFSALELHARKSQPFF